MMKRSFFILSMICIAAISCSKGDMNGEAYWGDKAGAYYESPSDPESPSEGDRFDAIQENPFVDAQVQPVSTFSVDADGASYAYMRRCLTSGYFPPANAVRIEEFLNYFTFDYPDPEAESEEDVALNAETGPCPWNAGHRLMRLGIKGRSLTGGQIPQANFVFLIDISGSMSSMDKLPLFKTGLVNMLDYMRPDDRVAIVTYASGEQLLLESTPVSEKDVIKKAISSLAAKGSTAGSKGMQMAYEQAEKNFIEGANNRVIMGTDGDFNVGITGADAILEFVQNYAAKGIYLTICGFGSGNLNDSMMERVSGGGNGTYEYIDSELEMAKVFVNERSRFITVATDCKTQITFDPEVVKSYRLIGYENRVLANDDFENDKVDAAEVGSGQTITALYEIEPAEGTEGSPAKFSFRYKKKVGEESRLLETDVPAEVDVLSENLSFASSLACWGLCLRNSAYKGSASRELALSLARESVGSDPYGLRAQYVELLGKAASIQ